MSDISSPEATESQDHDSSQQPQPFAPGAENPTQHSLANNFVEDQPADRIEDQPETSAEEQPVDQPADQPENSTEKPLEIHIVDRSESHIEIQVMDSSESQPQDQASAQVDTQVNIFVNTPVDNEMRQDDPPYITEACEREALQYEEYRLRLTEHRERFTTWHARCQKLYEVLTPVLERCIERLLASRKLAEELTPEVQTKLGNRQKSLDIVTKVVQRLQGRLPMLIEDFAPTLNLERLSREQWRQFLEADTEPKEDIIKHHLKQLEGQYWDVLSHWRSAANKQQSHFKDFIKVYVLPPLDGLFDGKPLSEPIVQNAKNSYPAETAKLTEWLGVYDTCAILIESALEEARVYRIPFHKGTPFDDETQEPVDTEQVPDMQDNQTKELCQHGYRILESERNWILIRRTQVIVVKN